jgi:hypothetical protein
MFEKSKRRLRKTMDKAVNKIIGEMIRSKERALPIGGWQSGPHAGDALIAHQEYVLHTEAPIRYIFKDIVSFVDYCDANINPDAGGIILYTNSDLTGLHNYYMPRGNRVHYNFELSPELMAWGRVVNHSHRAFKEFLEERLDELTDVTIFKTLATLKMNTTIHFESDFDDDRNYGFIYKEKDGKGSSKIPKELTIKVPFFVGDPTQEINLRLIVSQPKDPESKPRFTVEIIGEQRLLADNVARLIVNLRKAWPDHMILHGEI